MENLVGIFVFKDADGQIQLSLHVAVHLLHHHQRDVLVRDAADECVLQNMRERAMSDVVHQDGCLHGLSLRVEDVDSLLYERLHGLRHEVEGTQ